MNTKAKPKSDSRLVDKPIGFIVLKVWDICDASEDGYFNLASEPSPLPRTALYDHNDDNVEHDKEYL